MKISRTAHYPADPAAVFAVVADEDFQSAKCVETGARSHTVSVVDEGERTVITTERTLPSDGIPEVVKSLVGDTITVVEKQDWGPPNEDGSRAGTVTISVAGAPMAMHGDLALRTDEHSCLETIDIDLKAPVPLIGGKIEKAAAPAIEAAISAEIRLIHERLG